jgi:ribonuclease D
MSKIRNSSIVQSVPYLWIDSPAQLNQMTAALSRARRVAIDSEGDSLYHYREKICLIQFSTDDQTFILDPLALRDLSLLSAFLADSSVEKVFHAAINDIAGLRRDFGFTFAHIFDTQVAAQFLGYEQTGLAMLLDRLLGIQHPKERQQDDWSRRPLNQEQLEYAARDTHHLLALRDLLEARLKELGRWHWAEEECVTLACTELVAREFDPEGFRRIKGSRELQPKEQSALRALYVLRENIAQSLDLPPFKVINNPVLLDLARRPPANLSEVLRRKGLPSRLQAKLAPKILEAVQKGLREKFIENSQGAREKRRPPTADYRRRLEQLKKWRVEKSRKLELAPGVLFPGFLLEWLAGYPVATLEDLRLNPEMRHWRVDLFGAELLQLMGDSHPC